MMPATLTLANGPPFTTPVMVRFVPSAIVNSFAEKLPNAAITLEPLKLAAPAALPNRLPAVIAPVSPIVPVVAIRPTVPPPAADIAPGMAMSVAVSATALPVMLPPTVSPATSVIVAAAPPASAPLTDSAAPSFSANPAAVKLASAAIWLLPVRLAVVTALPDSVPAIRLPVSPIEPVVAIRPTVPPPPSVTTPGMLMLPAVRPMALAVTVPPIVRLPLSTMLAAGPPFSVPFTARPMPSFSTKSVAEKLPSAAIWLVVGVCPTRFVAPVELPVRVPETSVPVSVIVPASATRLTVPPPLSVTTPAMPMMLAVNAIAAADSVPSPPIVSEPLSNIVAFGPPIRLPLTARSAPSSSVKPIAEKLLTVPT